MSRFSDEEPDEALELICWRAACASQIEQADLRDRLIAEASQRLQRERDSERASRPAFVFPQAREPVRSFQTEEEVLPLLGPSILGRSRGPAPGFGGRSPNQGLNQLAAEYRQAKAAYEADYARYDQEMQMYSSRAGQWAAMGIDPGSLAPREPDPLLYQRYLSAKAAYEAAGGR